MHEGRKRAGLVTDDVGDRLLVGDLREAVGLHPLLAEDLVEVATPAVREQDHHDRVRGQRACGLEGGCHGHAARPSDEQSLLAGEAPGHVE